MPNMLPSNEIPVNLQAMGAPGPVEVPPNPTFDFSTGEFVFGPSGAIVTASKGDSVAIRVKKSLNVPRYGFVIFPRWYGEEVSALVGRSLPDDIMRSELERRFREVVLMDPGVDSIVVTAVTTDGDRASVWFQVQTVYKDTQLSEAIIEGVS